MTAKTKSGQLRITKSIGALGVGLSEGLNSLTNEKITAYIERSNGSNEEIATNIPLNAFIGLALFGDGYIQDGTANEQTALCEIANNGAIKLEENESIIVSLTDLKSANTYSLNGIEIPVRTPERLFLTEKVLLAGQKNREYDVEQFESAILMGDFSKVRLTYATAQGPRTVEFLKNELSLISADMGKTEHDLQSTENFLPVNLVGVSTIEIFSDNQVNIVLKDINKI